MKAKDSPATPDDDLDSRRRGRKGAAMARTAVDLPDPQPTPADGAATNNADDLLAQLAGEEVDRLLSEADGAAETAGPVEINRDRAAAKGGKGEGEASLDTLFGDLNEAEQSALAEGEQPSKSDTPEKPKAVQTRAKAEPAAARPESGADALAAEMEEDDRAHAAAVRRMKGGSAAAAAEAAVAMPEVPTPLKSAGAVEEQRESDDAEEEGPTAEVEAAMPFDDPSGRGEQGVMIDEVELDAPTPLLVILLEWLNAPLAGLPDGVRRAIGTVALVTTVNAIGVIAYVLLFRRHGH